GQKLSGVSPCGERTFVISPWGQGVGKSTFPHLNININGEKGHIFLRDKIINRGQWDDFEKFFE
ncbi:hypothetical protein RCT88_20095, partial [Escherichia marmotae]|nr:hypothetical protein [Escherichia marmotae]